jgi:hypothetical protein
MKRSSLILVLLGTGISFQQMTTPQVVAAQQAEKPIAEAEQNPFSALAKALPFPPDAHELEFRKTFGRLDFMSRSSLDSLVDFYQREMQKRGWEQDASAFKQKEDRVDMTFKHDGAKVDIELSQRSDGVNVFMDCEKVDFAGVDDPAGLAAAGIPQPRANLYLQKEVPRPDAIRDLEYRKGECLFKAPMPLQEAFDYYLKTLKGMGWQESRRPIISSNRRYTEFKRGEMKLSVNIFSHEVGSRFILRYEDDRKDPVVPPLAPVASIASQQPGTKTKGDKGSDMPATIAVDVTKNTGSATVTHGSEKYVLKQVVAYQTKRDGASKTTIIFSERPIPLDRMQQALATKDNFKYGDLYQGVSPISLTIQVNGFTSFYLATQSGGVGNTIEDSDCDIKVEQGRVRGSIKMSQPKKIFDEPFQLNATIDAAVLTPNTRLGGAAERPKLTARKPTFPGSELLLPDDVSEVRSEGTRNRKSTHAIIDADLQSVADFYRTQLAAQQWKEDEAARVWKVGAGEPKPHATLQFVGPKGKITVKLVRENLQTVIDVTATEGAKSP